MRTLLLAGLVSFTAAVCEPWCRDEPCSALLGHAHECASCLDDAKCNPSTFSGVGVNVDAQGQVSQDDQTTYKNCDGKRDWVKADFKKQHSKKMLKNLADCEQVKLLDLCDTVEGESACALTCCTRTISPLAFH